MPTISNNVGAVSPTVSAATIAGYRNAFNQGNFVRQADIQNLINLYDIFRSHSHAVTSFTDYYWIAYGNTSPYSTTSGTSNLGGMSPALGALTPVTQGNNILASNVNGFAAAISAIPNTHYHPMSDVVW